MAAISWLRRSRGLVIGSRFLPLWAWVGAFGALVGLVAGRWGSEPVSLTAPRRRGRYRCGRRSGPALPHKSHPSGGVAASGVAVAAFLTRTGAPPRLTRCPARHASTAPCSRCCGLRRLRLVAGRQPWRLTGHDVGIGIGIHLERRTRWRCGAGRRLGIGGPGQLRVARELRDERRGRLGIRRDPESTRASGPERTPWTGGASRAGRAPIHSTASSGGGSRARAVR